MVNLLPDKHRKNIEAEYRSRVLLMSLYFVAVFFMIASTLLLPSYFLSREKLVVAGVSLSESQAGETKRELSVLNEKLSVISMEKSSLPVSEIISLIIPARGGGIYIKNISYESRGNTSKIDVSGTAKTGDSLVGFIERLKKEKKFSEVYSPIPGLIKEKNADFTVQIGITQ